MADLGRKLSNFRYHGNKGRPNENVNSTIKSAVPENPLFGANAAALAFYKPSYGRFGSKMVEFSLPWQQGSTQ